MNKNQKKFLSTNRKHVVDDVWYIYTTDTMQNIRKKCRSIYVNIKRSKYEEAHLFSCHLTDLSNHLMLLVPL